MSVLQNLVKSKSVSDSKIEVNTQNPDDIRKTFFNDGKSKCKSVAGSPQILKSCLEENHAKFKEESRKDSLRQQELKASRLQAVDRQKTELKKHDTTKTINEDEKGILDKKISIINNAISQVRSTPEEFGLEVNKKPRAGFWIGLILLVPMTLYLFVFYVSASYSAFFKNFTADSNIVESIFDAEALSKAYHDGILEAIFICTIPFVFMGLGYLIHMFRESEDHKIQNIIKIMLLFALTFVFDGLLAYFIEKNLYEINKTLMDPPFGWEEAISSPGFWIIIFAGFVVYIVWGIVFDFVMKEYESIDVINGFIKVKKKERKELQKRIEILEKTINLMKEKISEIEGKIDEIQSEIDGFIFESKAYLLYHKEFFSGWNIGIGEYLALPHSEKEKLIAECQRIEEEHLRKYNLTEDNAENIIYKQAN